MKPLTAAADAQGQDEGEKSAPQQRDHTVIEFAIRGACKRIAPLWPLKHFVAVNPFLGFSNQSFHATCATLRRVAQVDMLMQRAFYRNALDEGRIEDQDLERALSSASKEWPLPTSVSGLRYALAEDAEPYVEHKAVVATVAEILDKLAAGDRRASRTAFMIDEISKFCAAYFDKGQAVWQLPSRNRALYSAWRAAVRHDCNPEMMGIQGFRTAVAQMPGDPTEVIIAVVEALGIPERAVEDYLHRALFDIGGWAAYAGHLVWNSNLVGQEDDTLVHLLAVRVVWGYALFLERKDIAFREAWRQAMEAAASKPIDEGLGEDADLALRLVMQQAYEGAYQRRLLSKLSRGLSHGLPKAVVARKPLQAAFCIDVRSEVYRRALETACPEAETIGFAGFFGFPIEYVPIGHQKGRPQCPVLLKPSFTVCETVQGASVAEEQEILGLRQLRRRASKAWKSFKLSAVSSFTYVETVGLLFAAKIASDCLGLTRTVKDPNIDGLDPRAIGRVGPCIDVGTVGGRPTGFDHDQRLAMAAAVLRTMSLTGNFARLVMLTGHGSTTVNNPHASGLDCGACGGHTGEANARVASSILNDPNVRVGLKSRGIEIPDDTWFLGCLHDTTTDDIEIFDAGAAPASHKQDIHRLRSWLSRASALARRERAAVFGLSRDAGIEAHIKKRSHDWSQVRPEWGLAGNAAFIAAPRNFTVGIDLEGRSFLHNYDWHLDADFGVLELIMTAPLVVASWINLQYYGSTVNNRVFGAGNKVLHNVTGTIGVLEGNAGDLKVGLPWQSVHNGNRMVHEPLRLNVFIAAPIQALNDVIAKHEVVRCLVDHNWVHLFAISECGQVSHRYRGFFNWEALL